MYDGAVQLRATALQVANGSLLTMAAKATDVAQRLQARLPAMIADGQMSVSRMQRDGIDRLANLRADYEQVTSQVQEIWRYVVIAVFFGILIILCIVAAWAIGTGNAPRTGYTCTLLLWVQTAVLMLAGAGESCCVDHCADAPSPTTGLLAGTYSVSGDACLYTESYLLRQLQDISNATVRERAMLGLQYYTETVNLTDLQVLCCTSLYL